MKKLFMLIFAFACSSAVLLAGGVDDPEKNESVAVMKGNNGQIKVFYKGDNSSLIKISIYDKNNLLRFNEKIKSKSDFVRPYDLSELQKGDYRIVIETPSQTFVEHYVYENKPSVTAHVQKLKGSDNKFLLTVSDPQAEEVQVDVLNAEGKLLMSHKIAGKGQFAQLYNLNKVDGEVYFQVSSDSGTVTAER